MTVSLQQGMSIMSRLLEPCRALWGKLQPELAVERKLQRLEVQRGSRGSATLLP